MSTRKFIRNFYINVAIFFKKVKPGIHILNSHYVTPNEHNVEIDIKEFEQYLQYLNKKGRFINLEEATFKIINNDIPKDETLISFSFDDGFEECYTVIAPLLEKYNCRGAFFINANYIDSDLVYQNEFNKRIVISTKKPMTWLQVKDLHSRGHLIGSHNLDHTNFEFLNEDEIENQLKINKEILEKNLNYNCEYFAWTYGQIKHFPKSALEVSLKYYKYIYSGTNYKKYFSYDGKVLNRRHHEAFWSKPHLKYFLSFEKK